MWHLVLIYKTICHTFYIVQQYDFSIVVVLFQIFF